ncbi:SUMF1/EgtB/PvdO family nonheme iron enzyme [Hyphomonas johnsonii]|uniref:TIR domain-containing protein n=1 Tax=Hyphomonas johnsonii MHS-2 TaxID=1280950 RepID=A0A059F9Q4_9PROT|nr:SUMF1/EgtB/PvdO family nonheme iron enzyme [Hyphomonas johnsonii]KCZ87330.1 hypothetical protein HJO_16827 [Hyphomonas johnsonii MHS-2]
MANVFLSYSRADRPKAQQVAAALEEEGLTVWWDKVLQAGQTYDEVTEGMLRNADVVVVLWSTVSVKSKWVRAEATLGERYSAVIPAMIENADRPILFELTQTADLIGWDGDRAEPRWAGFVTDLRQAVDRKIAQKAAKAEPAPVPPVQVPAAAAPAAPAAAPQKPAFNDATIETTFWTSIQSATDPADYRAYLKRYPEGHYADLARNRLAALEQKLAAPPPPPPPGPSPSPARAAAPAPAKRPVGLVPMVAGGLVLLLGAGWGVSKLMPAADTVELAETELPPEPDATPAAEPDVPAMVVEADTAGVAPASPSALDVPEAPEPEAEAEPEPEPVVPAGPAADCELCPVMAIVPEGSFMMGSPESESQRVGNEGPQREVTLKPYAISVNEITFAEWDACTADGGCGGYRPGDAGTRDDMPAQSISWRDATAYTTWLSGKTGRTYRLPTEAEWEYAARAGAATPYWWGAAFDRSMVASGAPKPVSSLAANAFGLTGTLGNVREWVQDCYVNNYTAAPLDGSAVLNGDCDRRVVRGGAWSDNAATHRAANRARVSRGTRDRKIGFRVVRDEP